MQDYIFIFSLTQALSALPLAFTLPSEIQASTAAFFFIFASAETTKPNVEASKIARAVFKNFLLSK